MFRFIIFFIFTVFLQFKAYAEYEVRCEKEINFPLQKEQLFKFNQDEYLLFIPIDKYLHLKEVGDSETLVSVGIHEHDNKVVLTLNRIIDVEHIELLTGYFEASRNGSDTKLCKDKKLLILVSDMGSNLQIFSNQLSQKYEQIIIKGESFTSSGRTHFIYFIRDENNFFRLDYYPK
ncbi:MAG: hypothetical protein ACJA1K_000202 [Cognaticolwellia sp.]|jgi:hypothetical protein|tara:strand:- start:14399 stop:14926 length:528 start_codon:yes stop_codon:yes gene_type:complete